MATCSFKVDGNAFPAAEMSAPESGRALVLQEALAAMTSKHIDRTGSEEVTFLILSISGWLVPALEVERPCCPGCGVYCTALVGEPSCRGLLWHTLAK